MGGGGQECLVSERGLGEESSGRRESRSGLERRVRRISAAKQATKIPARQEDTRMVRAMTSMGGESGEESRRVGVVLGGNCGKPRMDSRKD